MQAPPPPPGYAPPPPTAGRFYQPSRGGGRIPEGWRESSKGGVSINGLAPVKTPLSEVFDGKLPPDERWTPADCLAACGGAKVGLLIDLTNTSRYYDASRLPREVRYLKLSTEGHMLPSEKNIERVRHACAARSRHTFLF